METKGAQISMREFLFSLSLSIYLSIFHSLIITMMYIMLGLMQPLFLQLHPAIERRCAQLLRDFH